jgi:hypothetical protein
VRPGAATSSQRRRRKARPCGSGRLLSRRRADAHLSSSARLPGLGRRLCSLHDDLGAATSLRTAGNQPGGPRPVWPTRRRLATRSGDRRVR